MEYVYIIAVKDGSGEFALRALLFPVRRAASLLVFSTVSRNSFIFHAPATPSPLQGAYAKDPVGPRLQRLAQRGGGRLPFTVTCVYGGSHDWTSLAAGKLCMAQLNEQDPGKEPRHLCVRVSNSGHTLFMENPEEFSAKLIAAFRRGRALDQQSQR